MQQLPALPNVGTPSNLDMIYNGLPSANNIQSISPDLIKQIINGYNNGMNFGIKDINPQLKQIMLNNDGSIMSPNQMNSFYAPQPLQKSPLDDLLASGALNQLTQMGYGQNINPDRAKMMGMLGFNKPIERPQEPAVTAAPVHGYQPNEFSQRVYNAMSGYIPQKISDQDAAALQQMYKSMGYDIPEGATIGATQGAAKMQMQNEQLKQMIQYRYDTLNALNNYRVQNAKTEEEKLQAQKEKDDFDQLAKKLSLMLQEKGLDIQQQNAETNRMSAQEKIEKPIREKQQKAQDTLLNIDYAENLIRNNPNAVGIYSPVTAVAGRLTGGVAGMSKKDLGTRGEIARAIGMIKNDLIAQARGNGQTGINTMAEINQAAAGLDENSSAEELLGALKTMRNIAKRVSSQSVSAITKGTRSKSKSGKPIIYNGTQWVYE